MNAQSNARVAAVRMFDCSFNNESDYRIAFLKKRKANIVWKLYKLHTRCTTKIFLVNYVVTQEIVKVE